MPAPLIEVRQSCTLSRPLIGLTTTKERKTKKESFVDSQSSNENSNRRRRRNRNQRKFDDPPTD